MNRVEQLYNEQLRIKPTIWATERFLILWFRWPHIKNSLSRAKNFFLNWCQFRSFINPYWRKNIFICKFHGQFLYRWPMALPVALIDKNNSSWLSFLLCILLHSWYCIPVIFQLIVPLLTTSVNCDHHISLHKISIYINKFFIIFYPVMVVSSQS